MKLTSSFRRFPKILALHIAKVLPPHSQHYINQSPNYPHRTYCRKRPNLRPIHTPPNQTLRPHLLIKLPCLFQLAVLRWTTATIRVFFADFQGNYVPFLKLIVGVGGGCGGGGGALVAINLAGPVLIIMRIDFEMRDWAAVIEIRDVGFGVELFLRDVAVVCGF